MTMTLSEIIKRAATQAVALTPDAKRHLTDVQARLGLTDLAGAAEVAGALAAAVLSCAVPGESGGRVIHVAETNPADGDTQWMTIRL